MGMKVEQFSASMQRHDDTGFHLGEFCSKQLLPRLPGSLVEVLGELTVKLEIDPQAFGNRKNKMTVSIRRKNMFVEMLSKNVAPFSVATWTQTSAFTGKRN